MLYCRALFTLFALASLASADEVVQILNGAPVTGSITSIGASEITLKTASGPVTVPLKQVLGVTFRDKKPADLTAKITDVVLTDGTVLHCRTMVFEGKEVELTLPSGAVLKVPLNLVSSFVRDANNQPLTRKFEDIAAKKSNFDRIVILREGLLNPLEGTLGEVKGKTISFRSALNGNVIDVALEKPHGIIFFRNPATPVASPICRVNDIEGNTLTAAKLAYDGKRLAVTTPSGNELALPYEVLANLDFNLGKLTYLSDMTPLKIIEKSGIGLPLAFRRNFNLDGEPIYLAGQVFPKGLSMHAYTELEYNLDSKFKEFKGVLGVDVRTGAESQPKVTIYCDGSVVFAGTITPLKVEPINVSVKGVRTLRIVVSSKNELDLHDHVTFADAQVSQ